RAARTGPRRALRLDPLGARMPGTSRRLALQGTRSHGLRLPGGRWQRLAWLGALLLIVGAGAAKAQSFGKNKVHYEPLEWSVLETPHLRLHFYTEEESLARALSTFAESVTVEYDHRFRFSPRARVPLLLYSTHHLFQQTNATPEQLTEAVGGLTELIK